MDLFVVPTIGFDLLYAFIIIRLDRRALAWINVTTNPTAEWIAGQVTEAFPWNEAPRYLLRDRDGAFGPAYIRRVRSARWVSAIARRATLAVAERTCEAAHRLDSARMPRPGGGVRRGELAP